MKKVLIILPFFFGYEKEIAKGFKDLGYDTTVFDMNKYSQSYFECWNKSLFDKMKRKMIKGQRERDRMKYEEIFADANWKSFSEQINLGCNHYSIVFVVKGDLIPDKYYREIRKNNPGAVFVLYLWDDVSLHNKRTHFSFFDRIYSYNVDDANLLKFSYLPVFQQQTQIDARNTEKQIDVAIIGTGHRDRIRFAKKLYSKYKNHYRFYIYFLKEKGVCSRFFVYDKSLPYAEYMRLLSESKTVIDFPAKSQKGPTVRVFDAIATRTKVITTNKSIEGYPVFSENILVIDEKRPIIPDAFVYGKYKDERKKILTVDEWIMELLK